MARKKAQTKEVVRTGAPATFYVNNVELRAMVWDFRMSMGEVISNSPERMEVKNTVDIYMSPQHAKVFSRVLANQVAAYEKAFGPIAVEADAHQVVE
jgi:hypothetical protein